MKKKYSKVLLVVIIVIVGLFGFIYRSNNGLVKMIQSYIPRSSTIPPHIIQWANYYIISIVGENYFLSNYRLNPEKSKSPEYSVTKRDLYGWYKIYYQYLPLSKLTGKPEYITVQIHSDIKSFEEFKKAILTKIGVIPNWVACFNGNDFCNFNISIDKAVDIIYNLRIPELPRDKTAIKEKISLHLPSEQSKALPYWEIGYSNSLDSTCDEIHSIHVNIEKGTVNFGGGAVICK